MSLPNFMQLTGRSQTLGLTVTFNSNATAVYWKYKDSIPLNGYFFADYSEMQAFHPFLRRTVIDDGGGDYHILVEWGATDGINEVVTGTDTLTGAAPTITGSDPLDTIYRTLGSASQYSTVAWSWEGKYITSLPVVEAVDTDGKFWLFVAPGATWTITTQVKIGSTTAATTVTGTNDTGNYLSYDEVANHGAGSYSPLTLVPLLPNFILAVNADSTQGTGILGGGGLGPDAAIGYGMYGGFASGGLNATLAYNISPAHLAGMSTLTANWSGVATVSTTAVSIVQPAHTPDDRDYTLVQLTYGFQPAGTVRWNAAVRQMAAASAVGHTVEYHDLNGIRHTSTGVHGSDTYSEPYGGLHLVGSIDYKHASTLTSRDINLFDQGVSPDTSPTEFYHSSWTRPAVNTSQLWVQFSGEEFPRFDWRWTQAKGGLNFWQDAITYLAGGDVAMATGTGNNQWQGTNATLSLVSGNLHIETTGSSASARMNQAVAYLQAPRVKIRCRGIGHDNIPFRLTLHLNTATALGSDIYTDLTTGADGEWVERSFLIYDMPSSPVDVFADVTRVTVGNLPNGRTIEVEWIRSERESESMVQCLDPNSAYLYRARTEGVLDLAGVSYLAGHTDGLYSLIGREAIHLDATEDAVSLDALKTRLDGRNKTGWHTEIVNATPAATGHWIFTSGGSTTDVPLYGVDAFYSGLGFPKWLHAGGILADNSLYGDQKGNDSAHKAQVKACPVFTYAGIDGVVYGHGHLNDIGSAWSASVVVDFIAVIGAQLCGQVVSGDGSIDLRRQSDHLACGSGSPDSGGWFVTGVPCAPYFLDEVALYEATADGFDQAYVGGAYFTTQPVVLQNAYTLVGLVQPRQRVYSRWRLLAKYGRMAIDSARQWLMVATGKKIDTFSLPKVMQLSNPAAEFSSGDTDGVSGWLSMIYHDRGPALWPVAKTSSGATVYVSRDGGKSGGEVLTVEAKSAAIEVDSERRMLILIYENGDNIQRRASEDGGATWSAAADVSLDGSAAQGTVLDLVQDGRQVGVLLLLAKVDAGTVVFRSLDRGKTWATVLS